MARIKPAKEGIKVYWNLQTMMIQLLPGSPVNWNDNDGIDSDGLNGDIDGNDKRGTGKLSSTVSTTDNNGVAKVILTGTHNGGDIL